MLRSLSRCVRPLVSCAWLAQQLRTPCCRLAIVDASWHMPSTGRNAYEEFLSERIPTSVFFDIDAVADTSTDLPHMLPSNQVFENAMTQLGITNCTHVVVYDSSDLGVFSSPRLWWMMHVFGHDRVSVLDGGMTTWKESGFQVDTSKFAPPKPADPPFKVEEKRDWLVVSQSDLKSRIGSKNVSVVDARSAERFAGTAPEPREGIPSGHMGGGCAVNLPFTECVDTEAKAMLPANKLNDLFQKRKIDPSNPRQDVVATCGSGISACVLSLAHAVAALGPTASGDKLTPLPVYDGSWTEWASTPGNAIEPLPKAN